MIKRSLSWMAAAVSWHRLVFFILCWHGAYTQRSLKMKLCIYLNSPVFNLLENDACRYLWNVGCVFSSNSKDVEICAASKGVTS
jgi:hypothetical protein